ncbi:MAG: hypothetical protein IJW63_11140 [Lachnospiraceae bacterium]|nr:hypothetical protein [Lachnospiraceae bacterium]
MKIKGKVLVFVVVMLSTIVVSCQGKIDEKSAGSDQISSETTDFIEIEEVTTKTEEEIEYSTTEEVSSQPQEEEHYLYSYEGDSYRYAITMDFEELLSFHDEKGSVEVLTGGGTYQIQDDLGQMQVEAIGLQDYLVSDEDGNTVVWAIYEMSDGSKAANKYTMYEDHINVVAVLQSVDSPYQTYEAILDRNFLCQADSCEKKVSSQWVYPDNGDFPYKVADGIVTIQTFEETRRLYTFLRGSSIRPLILFEDYPEEDIPVYIEDANLEEYQIEYDLVFENHEDKKDADLLALFKGRNSSFAVKIDCVTEETSKSTLYYADEVEFDINITNLAKDSNNLAVDYVLYDYNGTPLLTESITLVVESDEQIDIPIFLQTTQKGIFYIDLKIDTLTEEYRELYSFALLSEHEHEYADTNPFGVSGVRFGEYEPNDTTVELLEALGAFNVRVCISCPDYLAEDKTILDKYLKRLVNANIRVNGQFLLMDDWVMPTQDNAQEYMTQIDETLNVVGKYLSSCEIGNEYNLNHDKATTKAAMQQYIKEYFEPGYKVIKEQYSLPFINAAVGLSDVDWMKAMVSAGIYDKQQILATHAYGFPWAPDRYTSSSFELSIEGSLKRTKKFLSQYGNMTWFVNEIGYPTAAMDDEGKTQSVDLRTQADYLVRANILALSYGADEVEVYSLYDQPNVFKGLDPTNNEFHFGLFYYEDYFGRVMPKPSAVAYQNMTSCLDGVQACNEIETNSATARVFRLELADGELVYAGWSNCSRLINDKKGATKRTPVMPWENQWKESESVLIPVDGNYVEVVNTMGNKSVVPVINGYVNVALDGSPKFIKIIN